MFNVNVHVPSVYLIVAYIYIVEHHLHFIFLPNCPEGLCHIIKSHGSLEKIQVGRIEAVKLLLVG